MQEFFFFNPAVTNASEGMTTRGASRESLLGSVVHVEYAVVKHRNIRMGTTGECSTGR